MSALEETRESLRKEISALLDKLSSARAQVIFENSAEGINGFLDDLERLHRKTAALQALLNLPEEKPVIVEKIVEKVVEKIVEKPAEPVVFIPEIPKAPEPVKTPEAPKTPEPVIPPVIAKTEPVAEKTPEPKPVAAIKTEAPAVKTEEKKPEGKKLPDMRSFIGFNEKIMFVRLFKNDSAAYEEAINQINNSASHDEAKAFISVLHGEYSWNSSNESVQTFLDTVKRRFS